MYKRKKVLMFLLNDFLPDQRVLKQARSLRRLDYEVKIICTHHDKTLPSNENIENGILISRERIINIPFIKYLHFWIKGIIKNYRSKYHIFVCHDLNTLPIGAILRILNKNKRLVYDTHELWPSLIRETLGSIWFWFFTALEKTLIQKSDLITGTTPIMAKFLQSYYNIKNPVDFLYNVPEESINNISKLIIDRHENEVLFAMVGWITKVSRGFEQLPKIISHLKSLRKPNDPLIRIMVIGDGPFRSIIEKLLIKMGHSDVVHFMGNFPYEKAMGLAKSCDIGLILTQPTSWSWLYTCPNRLFEYIGNTLPIIATDLPGTSYIIKKNNIGKIVEPGNPFIIAEAILEFSRSQQEINDIKQRLPEIFLQKYTWDRMEKKISNLYSKLLLPSSETFQ